LSDPETALARARVQVLGLYSGVTVLMLLGIAVLVVYAILLGPLTSPGKESSFGYAVALMSLMGAVLFHVLDRTYRSWPLGRKFSPKDPGPVTVETQVLFVKVVVVALAAGAIASLLAGLLT
jgi:hypothetical protein